MNKYLIGQPVKVKMGSVGFKKGLFMKLSPTGKHFYFLHLPTYEVYTGGLKVLKRPISELISWDNKKEYEQLIPKHARWIREQMNI